MYLSYRGTIKKELVLNRYEAPVTSLLLTELISRSYYYGKIKSTRHRHKCMIGPDEYGISESIIKLADPADCPTRKQILDISDNSATYRVQLLTTHTVKENIVRKPTREK